MNAELKALIKQLSTKSPTGLKLPTGLVDYIRTKQLATNVPSGPKSISLRKEVSFAPFPAVTPGEPGGGVLVGRRTVDASVAVRATRPVEIHAKGVAGHRPRGAAAAALAPVLAPDVPSPPPPVVLSLVRTRPLPLSLEDGQLDRVRDESRPEGRRWEASHDTEPGGPLFSTETSESRLSSEPETFDHEPATTIVGLASAPAVADTDPGGTPIFDDDEPAVAPPGSTSPAHGSAPRIVGDTRAEPAWRAFVFPGDWSPLFGDTERADESAARAQASRPMPTSSEPSAFEPPAPFAAPTRDRRARHARVAALALLAVSITGTSCGLLYGLARARSHAAAASRPAIGAPR